VTSSGQAMLTEFRSALVRIVEVLTRHGWPVRHWTDAIADIDRMLESSPSPEELTQWAGVVGEGFADRMGSMRDTYFEEGFEELVEMASGILGRIEAEARSAHGFIPKLRRHLTEIEDRLLDQGESNEAALLRRVLSAESFDLDMAERLLTALEGRSDLAPAIASSCDAARRELDAIRQRA
jgi:hypothetical protein